MRDPAREPTSEPADLQAFLYASGELDPTEAAAFEARLGSDQAAREALCQAVQLTQTLAHQAPLLPDPSYRGEVRLRLRRRNRWGWLIAPRTYRGHPALWSAAGAVAAVLLVMALSQLPAGLVTGNNQPLPPPRPPETQMEPATVIEPSQVAATDDVAARWADLHSIHHVTRAHDEEMRRRQRLDERNKLTKPADRRSKPLSNLGSKTSN